MRKVFSWILFLLGAWMLVCPQSTLGLKQLKWLANYAFPGEILIGIVVVSAGLYLMDLKYEMPHE